MDRGGPYLYTGTNIEVSGVPYRKSREMVVTTIPPLPSEDVLRKIPQENEG